MEGTFGSYLSSLLTTVAEYRAKWDRPDRSLRRAGLNQAAIARTLMEHASATGGDGRSFTAWKTLVWRAVGDRTCSEEFLETLIEVFAIDENPTHEQALRAAHNATFGMRSPLDPLPSRDWVPPEVRRRIGPMRGYRTLSVHDRHVVGSDRRAVSHRTTHVIEATRAGCDRYFLSTDVSDAEVEVSVGGEVIAVYEVDGGLRCTEIGIGRDIPVGQSHVFESITTFGHNSVLPPRVRRASLDRLRRVSIMVTFDRSAVPERVWWGEWDSIAEGAEPALRIDAAPDGEGVVHRFVERSIHPVVGFEWEW